jgi:hypothetical protein
VVPSDFSVDRSDGVRNVSSDACVSHRSLNPTSNRFAGGAGAVVVVVVAGAALVVVDDDVVDEVVATVEAVVEVALAVVAVVFALGPARAGRADSWPAVRRTAAVARTRRAGSRRLRTARENPS